MAGNDQMNQLMNEGHLHLDLTQGAIKLDGSYKTVGIPIGIPYGR